MQQTNKPFQTACWARKTWGEHKPLPADLQRIKEAMLARLPKPH